MKIKKKLTTALMALVVVASTKTFAASDLQEIWIENVGDVINLNEISANALNVVVAYPGGQTDVCALKIVKTSRYEAGGHRAPRSVKIQEILQSVFVFKSENSFTGSFKIIEYLSKNTARIRLKQGAYVDGIRMETPYANSIQSQLENVFTKPIQLLVIPEECRDES